MVVREDKYTQGRGFCLFACSLLVFISFLIGSSNVFAVAAKKPMHPKKPVVAKSAPVVWPKLWPVDINLNEQKLPDVLLVYETRDHHLWVSGKDIRSWKLTIPKTLKSKQFENQLYYDLDFIKGIKYHIDKLAMRLDVTVPATLFPKQDTSLYQNGHHLAALPKFISPFFNYDVEAERIEKTEINGDFDFGLSTPIGVGTSEFLNNGDHSFLRTQTVWTYDSPSKMTSFRVGDSATGSGTFGRSVYFGGIQFARNFNTQPYFIQQPIQSVDGVASVPSTLDIYLNHKLFNHENVKPGPFDFNSIPFNDGYGNVSIVTKDALGRQQVTQVSFYQDRELLKPGLHNYSFEMGFLRNDYAMKSNDYGRFIAVGSDRVGINKHFTAGWHGEVMGGQQTLGVSATHTLSYIGALDASVAVSHSKDLGVGELGSVAWDSHLPLVNFGIKSTWTTRRFTELGYTKKEPPPRLTNQVYFGIPSPHLGSLGISYGRQIGRGDTLSSSMMSATYSKNLTKNLYFYVSGMRQWGDMRDKTLSLQLNWSFDNDITLSAEHQWDQNNHPSSSLSLQKTAPYGSGIGYHVHAGIGHDAQQEAGILWNNRVGTYTADFARLNGTNNYRLGVRGGMVLFDKHFHLTRELTGGYAEVKVGKGHDIYPNMPVYVNNELVDKTDKDGLVFIPNLGAYIENRINLDMKKLPISSKLDNNILEVVPYYMSGVKVVFPVQPYRAAIVSLTDAKGNWLPSGGAVTIKGVTDPDNPEGFMISDEGEVFVQGLSRRNTLQAEYAGNMCEFKLNYPDKDKNTIPDLGKHVCHLIKKAKKPTKKAIKSHLIKKGKK